MAQAKQGKQDKKSAKADKAKKAKEPEKVQVKAAVKAEKTETGAKGAAEGKVKAVAAKSQKPAEVAKAVAAKSQKPAEVAKAAAKRAPKVAAVAQDEVKVVAAKAEKPAEVAKVAAKRVPKVAAVAQDEVKAVAVKAQKSVEVAKTAAVKAQKPAEVAKAAAKRAPKVAAVAQDEAEKPAEVAKAAAKRAPKVAAAAQDEAQRAKEEFKSAKATAKAVLKAEDRELEPAAAKKLIEQVAAEIIAADAASAAAVLPTSSLTELLRLKPGAPVDLAAFDTRATPGVQTRAQAEAELAVLAARVGELQERLYAAATGGGSKRRVLVVLQGMDTSGKGGTVRHVAGLLDPNGTHLKAFKAPTPEELEHDFLWRIRESAPAAGQVGIFDRSQYEDVLVAKVRKLALPMHIGRRYGGINRFEKSLADDGCVVVKCFLHISPAEQRERLLARLENPDKHWKYSPSDVDDRLLWPEFQEAYRIALERCGTEDAPWHVVPADRKWYRNYAVLRLLIEALEGIDPQYPAGEFDLGQERARVLAS